MRKLTDRLLGVGLGVPDILLPAAGTDLKRWAVIACDQFTSDRAYWDAVASEANGFPSTYHLTLPEAYLRDGDVERRILAIQSTMRDYLTRRVLEKRCTCGVLIDRKTPFTPSRKGLVVCVDLERYDYTGGSPALIRATEETILDRIPPRVKIRAGAPLEFPHVMLLIDDPGRTVLEPLFERTAALETLYDTELMLNGGRVTGYRLDDEELLLRMVSALEALAGTNGPAVRQGEAPLLFAVGDGNHSLASAKEVWNRIKVASGDFSHPARFALVEIVNIYDEGLSFHPIHRVLFGVQPREVLTRLEGIPGVTVRYTSDLGSIGRGIGQTPDACTIGFVSENTCGMLEVGGANGGSPAGFLDPLLERETTRAAGAHLDYIHGTDDTVRLSGKPGVTGFLLPGIDRSTLFPAIRTYGSLPRKSFSIGEAVEKRYYLEGRRISRD